MCGKRPQKGRKTMNKKKKDYLRWTIFERDSYTCILCEYPASDLHHVISRAQGGSNRPDNLVSVCRSCHLILHGTSISGCALMPAVARGFAERYLRDYYKKPP
jgi:5-methylcytosine-specific restriction endonuclease McrA